MANRKVACFMSSTRITLEPAPGASIEEVAKDATRIARLLHVEVVFIYLPVTLYVNKDDNWHDVVREFERRKNAAAHPACRRGR